MRIGFLYITNPYDIHRHYPLGFTYLINYLRKNLSQPVEAVWLENGFNNNYGHLDIICLSCISQDFDDIHEPVHFLKEKYPDTPLLLGGNHITNFPYTLPELIDAGIVGEGEITFLELVKLFIKNKKFDPDNLKRIDGIVYREPSGKLTLTKQRKLISNLDDIGLPDRSIFPDQKKAAYLLTSRGCPYTCAFCSSSLFWKKTRFFSADYIANDIESIINQYPDEKIIGIWDDLFISNKNMLLTLNDKLKERNVLDKLMLYCNVRANLISEDICMILQRLNIAGVSFGFESADKKILSILKPDTSPEINLNALNILKKFHIPVCCSFILGTPGETEQEARLTLDTILEVVSAGKLIEPHLNVLMPMPNTIFWKQAEQQGLLSSDNNMQWSRLRYYASYLDSTFETPEEWAQARLNNKSIYLNEEYLKEEILLGLIVDYEKKIKNMREKIISEHRPYPYYAHVDPSIPNNAHSFVLNRIKPDSTVLECGSSGAHLTKILKQKNCVIDCIENDKTIANMAYKYTRNMYIENLENQNFIDSLSSKEYDYILFCDVLEHLTNPEKCLSEIKNKLKEDGKVLASIPNVAHGSVRLKLLKGKFEYEESGLLDKSHLRFFEFYSIIDLFNNADLFIEEIDLVRIPLEHELSKINLDDFEPNMIQQVKNDKTSDVFQFVVTARKMNGKDELSNTDILFRKIFPEEIVSEPVLHQVPDIQQSPSIIRRLKNKIKRLVK